MTNLNPLLRFALGLANVPDATVAELDQDVPGFARLADDAKQLEPILRAAMPLFEQAEPHVKALLPLLQEAGPHLGALLPIAQKLLPLAEQAWPVLQKAYPDVVDVTPTVQDLIAYARRT